MRYEKPGRHNYRAATATAEGTLYYEYDPAGTVTLITAAHGYNFAGPTPWIFAHDNIDWIPRSGAAEMAYQVDGRNRLYEVDGSGSGAMNYTHDANGNLKSTLTGQNGVETTYEYNVRNQLRYLKSVENATTIASFDYDAFDSTGFDWTGRRLTPAGKRRGVVEHITFSGADQDRSATYDYDALGRLRAERIRKSGDTGWPTFAQVTVPSSPATGDVLYDTAVGYSDTAGFDKVGNRGSRTSSGVNMVAASGSQALQNQSGLNYDVNDRMNYVASPPSYDPNGNTKYQASYSSQATPGQVVSSSSYPDEYDFDNRLIRRSGTLNSQPITINLVYDGDGNRVSNIVNGVVTTYLVDSVNPTGYAQVLEEDDAEGDPIVSYIYGLALISQLRDTEPSWRFYGYDGHGNVRYLTIYEPTDVYNYDAFGILLERLPSAAASQTPNSHLYCGEQWDAHLGLYYLRARFQSPDEGRFWTMDTYEGDNDDPASLHKYLYVENNPIEGSDPSGLDMWIAQGRTGHGLHQEFDVGDPKGAYNAYEFGMPGGVIGFAKSLIGLQDSEGMITIRANDTNAPVILNQFGYIHSTVSQDAEVITALQPVLYQTREYNLFSFNCRTFAQGLFYGIAHAFPEQFTPPPISAGTYNGPSSMYYDFGF